MILLMCYVSYNIAVDEINWFEQSNRFSILINMMQSIAKNFRLQVSG